MADMILNIAALFAALAFILAISRFIKGPTPADRVVSFDVLTIISITGIMLIAVVEDRLVYLDVALVYALLSFLGVIVVARFLEKGF